MMPYATAQFDPCANSTTVRSIRAGATGPGEVAPARRFDRRYTEQLACGGRTVYLHTLRPSDRAALLAAFERTSPQTRYRRFFAPKSALSEREVRFLTEVDGERHVALGAAWMNPQGQFEGLAVARFVRLPDDPSTAEPAIVVIDAWQGRGLGRALLERLVAAARERGIDRFACSVVAGNGPMLRLLREYPGARFRAEDGVIHVTLDLEATAASIAA